MQPAFPLRIFDGFDSPKEPEPAPLPCTPLPSSAVRWRPMLASALIHACAALVLPPILDAIAIQYEAEAWREALRFERPLRIRLPGPIYLEPLPAADTPLEASAEAPAPGIAAPAPAVAPSAIVPAPRPQRAGGRYPTLADLDSGFEMPRFPRIDASSAPLPAPAQVLTGQVLDLGAGQSGRMPDLPPIQGSGSQGAGKQGSGNGAGRPGAGRGASGPAQVRAANPDEGVYAPSPLMASVLRQILASTRVAHSPNGIFDVVVESPAGTLVPETGVTLSGRPVRTVFLKVGAPRDWMLQYCIPSSEPAKTTAGGEVVRLAAPPVIQAPYPRLTYRPPARRHSYIMVHGYVEASGRFSALKMLGQPDPDEAWLVLTVLQRWEFRPATLGGRPARIEILLAITPE